MIELVVALHEPAILALDALVDCSAVVEVDLQPLARDVRAAAAKIRVRLATDPATIEITERRLSTGDFEIVGVAPDGRRSMALADGLSRDAKAGARQFVLRELARRPEEKP